MALQHFLCITGTSSINCEGVLYETGINSAEIGPLYIKVESISGNKQDLTAVVSFANNESQETVACKKYVFPLDLNGLNPIKQAYEHLKTLPEFAGATDC